MIKVLTSKRHRRMAIRKFERLHGDDVATALNYGSVFLAGMILPLLVWGFGAAIDAQIDYQNAQVCESVREGGPINLVWDCSEYLTTGHPEYLRYINFNGGK